MASDQARPWWASDDPQIDALAADEDPVTTHRSARRPETDRDPEPSTIGDTDHGPAPATHDPSTCGRCPICLGLRLLEEHRPDIAEHLSEASRHLAAAFRGLLETRPDGAEPGARTAPSGDPFERIDVQGPDAQPQSGDEACDGPATPGRNATDA